MEKIEIKDFSDIFDVNHFSKIDGYVDGFQINPETKELLHPTTVTLVKGFGVPDDFTIITPPEPEGGAILRFISNAWVQDQELFNQRTTAELEIKRKELIDQLDQRITRLERKKLVKRISEEELKELVTLTEMLFDVEELDISDPTVILPELP